MSKNADSQPQGGSRGPRIMEALASTPPFPEEEVRDALPAPLRALLAAIPDDDERAVAATAGLALLSGCLPNVEGIYDRRSYKPALFVFVVAPSGSGKGALSYARQLAKGIDDRFRQEYEAAVRDQKAGREAKRG